MRRRIVCALALITILSVAADCPVDPPREPDFGKNYPENLAGLEEARAVQMT